MRDKHEFRLLIIGDSISLGIAEIRGVEIIGQVPRCYVDILRTEFPYIRFIVNADIHRTTADGLELGDVLLRQHQPAVVLVMLGGNDADLLWKRLVVSNGKIVQNRIVLERYASNLTRIAQKVIATGALPILTDMPNHSLEIRGRYLSQLSGRDVAGIIARNGGQPASDRGLELYRQAAANVATAMHCPFVRYGTALSHRPPELVIGPDGVHPNNYAHEIIAEELKPAIQLVMDKVRTPKIGSKA